MFKKIICDILILAGLLAMWASTSRMAMQYISGKRMDDSSWLGTYQARNGDLVAFSYLDKVKKFRGKPRYSFSRPVWQGTSLPDLYVSGDSYTEKVPDSAYLGIHNYKFGRRFAKNLEYSLDTARPNLLVIQISERYAREYFNDTRIFLDVPRAAAANVRKKDTPAQSPDKAQNAANLLDMDNFFNKNINQNLQYNLFNYNFIVPVMMYKALFNYAVFDRASGDVVISNNRQQLFYKETVAAAGTPSSYSPLTPDEITHIVDNLNAIYEHYKAEGFNEIYLSIIPSTASIMQPDWYNRFIPIIQDDKRLRMKVIDVYSIYSKSKEVYFLPGDVHWNNKGMQVWLSQISMSKPNIFSQFVPLYPSYVNSILYFLGFLPICFSNTLEK